MANAVASRLGADNGGVDKSALFLKVWSGEVFSYFYERKQNAWYDPSKKYLFW